MIEKYYLNTETLPTIPTPHDGVIKEVEFDSEFLTLKFENDIFERDSVQAIHPNADSLIIRIHLLDSEFYTYKDKMRTPFRGDKFTLINNQKLKKLAHNEGWSLEYLYHYVAGDSVIIKLYQKGYILLDIYADYIEFEWIEK